MVLGMMAKCGRGKSFPPGLASAGMDGSMGRPGFPLAVKYGRTTTGMGNECIPLVRAPPRDRLGRPRSPVIARARGGFPQGCRDVIVILLAVVCMSSETTLLMSPWSCPGEKHEKGTIGVEGGSWRGKDRQGGSVLGEASSAVWWWLVRASVIARDGEAGEQF